MELCGVIFVGLLLFLSYSPVISLSPPFISSDNLIAPVSLLDLGHGGPVNDEKRTTLLKVGEDAIPPPSLSKTTRLYPNLRTLSPSLEGLHIDGNSISLDEKYHDHCIPNATRGVIELEAPDMPLGATTEQGGYHSGQYIRALLLPNCMKVFLYQIFPNRLATQHPTASVTIQFPFGFLDDEEDLPGMSHLLEHLLLQGSKHFPDSTALASMLLGRGGKTGPKTTTFSFDSELHHMRYLLKYVGDTFSQPILDTDTLIKEVKNVQSEYAMSMVNETNRFERLLDHLSNPDHPAQKRHWGNEESLLRNFLNDFLGLRDRLRKFFRRVYTANGATLVVSSSNSLDIMQQEVIRYFSRMPSEPPPPYPAVSQFPPSMLPMRVCSVPIIEEVDSLIIGWPIHFKDAASRILFETLNPLTYIPLGDQGPKSISHYLREKKWVTSVRYTVNRSSPTYMVFLTLQLTKEGVVHQREVTQSVFRYLDSVRASHLPLYMFEEKQRHHEFTWRHLWNRDLNFVIHQPSMTTVVARMAVDGPAMVDSKFWYVAMPHFNANQFHASQDTDTAFLKRRLYKDVKGTPQRYGGLGKKRDELTMDHVGEQTVRLTRQVLDLLKVENALVLLRSSSCSERADKKEPFFSSLYWVGRLSDAELAAIRSSSTPPGVGIPPPNPWVPSGLPTKVAVEREYTINKRWRVTVQRRGASLYGGGGYDRALGRITVRFMSDQFPGHGKQSRFMEELFSVLLRNFCVRDEFYPLYLAGYRCDSSAIMPFSVHLSFFGPTTNLTDFSKMYLEKWRNFEPTDEEIRIAMNKLKAEKYSFLSLNPIEQAVRTLDVALSDQATCMLDWEKIEPLVTPNRFRIFVHDVIARIHGEKMLGASWFQRISRLFFAPIFRAQGRIDMNLNAPSEQLYPFISYIKEKYTFDVYSAYRDQTPIPFHLLPQNKKPTIRVQSSRQRDQSYGVAMRFQFSASKAAEMKSFVTILLKLLPHIEAEFRKKLQYQEQVGYLVTASIWPSHFTANSMDIHQGRPAHLEFAVQSEDFKPPEILHSIDNFLFHFETQVLPRLSFESLPNDIVTKFWHRYISENEASHVRRVLVAEVWPRSSGQTFKQDAGKWEFAHPSALRSRLPITKKVDISS